MDGASADKRNMLARNLGLGRMPDPANPSKARMDLFGYSRNHL